MHDPRRMSPTAGPSRLRAAVLFAVVATVMARAEAPARGAEETTGFQVAPSVAGASHRDVTVVDWTDPPDAYFNLDVGLRFGAAWNGGVVRLELEYGAMIAGPGASYVALFGGYGTHVSRRWILELTAELGLHSFHDVGTLVGTYDVVRENDARLVFGGVRLTASSPRARWRWQPAFFIAVRADAGHETVMSNLRMTCPSLGFPDGPDCREGASGQATSSVGGISLMAGFELRRIVKMPAGRSEAGGSETD